MFYAKKQKARKNSKKHLCDVDSCRTSWKTVLDTQFFCFLLAACLNFDPCVMCRVLHSSQHPRAVSTVSVPHIYSKNNNEEQVSY